MDSAAIDIYSGAWYFLIYSFFGWVIEVSYHAVTLGKVVNRGFLCGPFCPVYGCGMTAVLFITSSLPKNENGLPNIWALFLVGIVFTTLIELSAGWALDKLFHARWWDYRELPFNLNGYICLKFSMIWGFAVVGAVRLVHPAIKDAVARFLPVKYGVWLLAAAYLIFIVDLTVTAAVVAGLNKKLTELDELNRLLRLSSDSLSEKIASGTFKALEKYDSRKLQAKLAKAEMKDNIDALRIEMEHRRNELLRSHRGLYRRVFKAFPKFQPHEHIASWQELKDYLKNKKK